MFAAKQVAMTAAIRVNAGFLLTILSLGYVERYFWKQAGCCSRCGRDDGTGLLLLAIKKHHFIRCCAAKN